MGVALQVQVQVQTRPGSSRAPQSSGGHICISSHLVCPSHPFVVMASRLCASNMDMDVPGDEMRSSIYVGYYMAWPILNTWQRCTALYDRKTTPKK